MEQNYQIKSICPSCKKEITFSFNDANEKEYFEYRKHSCPKCFKKDLVGWKKKY